MPSKMPVLPSVPEHSGKKLLALDLDETLVHSSFQVGYTRFNFNLAGRAGSDVLYCDLCGFPAC